MRFAGLIVSTVLLAEFKRVKHSLEVVEMCRLLIQIVQYVLVSVPTVSVCIQVVLASRQLGPN